MPKYLCMQRKLRSADGPKGQKPSPAQMQEMYAQFGAWQAKFKKNLIDIGGKARRGTPRHLPACGGRTVRGGQGTGRRLHDRLRREPR